jgi:hypothetical protein
MRGTAFAPRALALAAALLAATLGPATASARQVDPDENVHFVPAFVFIGGAPGDEVSRHVLVQNQMGVDVRLLVEVLDMQEGRGNSTALDYVPLGDAPRGAGAWVAPIDPVDFTIAAGEQRSLPIKLRIPPDAGAGGYYAALSFTIKDPDPKAQIPIDAVQPIPIFVTVAGTFEHDLRASVEPESRWHWSGGTATWTIDLRNEGDVHEVYGGRLKVDGLLSASRSRDLRPGILLPGEHRRIRQTFDLRDAPDLVGAKLRIENDQGDAVADDAPRVIVLPWWLLVVLALAVAIIWWRLRARRIHAAAWGADDDDGSWDPSSPAG